MSEGQRGGHRTSATRRAQRAASVLGNQQKDLYSAKDSDSPQPWNQSCSPQGLFEASVQTHQFYKSVLANPDKYKHRLQILVAVYACNARVKS